MSRVMRKEILHKYSLDMRGIRFGNSNFAILDRYSFCQASTLNLDRKDYVKIAVEF